MNATQQPHADITRPELDLVLDLCAERQRALREKLESLRGPDEYPTLHDLDRLIALENKLQDLQDKWKATEPQNNKDSSARGDDR